MSEFFPIAIAVLFLLVNAILAAKRGVVTILAAGLSMLGYLVVFLLVFTFLPQLADTYFDLSLSWKGVTITALLLAGVVFVWLRLVMGSLLRRLLGPDSKLHVFADGVPAAILSLLPGAIVVVFLFSCFRIAGTIQELNYVTALGREGIEEMGGKIPSYPRAGLWRESIENLPLVADALDRIDPFSRRAVRNAAAVVILDQAYATRSFLAAQPETEALTGDEKLGALDEDEGVKTALKNREIPALIFHLKLREKAVDSQLSPALKALHLRPVLERFIALLKPSANSGTTSPSN